MAETFTILLLMLVASNGAPVLAAWALGSRFSVPVDLGGHLRDQQPVFGSSKTWRGVIAALVTACLLSMLLGFGGVFGGVFGLLVVAGDLFSSFIKRRIGLQPSARCLGLDQLPESIFPSVYAVTVLGLDWWWAVVLSLGFMLVDIFASKPLYLLKIRQRPY